MASESIQNVVEIDEYTLNKYSLPTNGNCSMILVRKINMKKCEKFPYLTQFRKFCDFLIKTADDTLKKERSYSDETLYSQFKMMKKQVLRDWQLVEQML